MTNKTELHPLFTRLLDECDATLVTADNLEAYLAETDAIPSVLLFAGDPVRYPEGLDVAVVLPELCANFPNQCRIALVSPDDERALAAKWTVTVRPTLVFLRGADYMTKIVKMQDWDVYVELFKDALNAPTQTATNNALNETVSEKPISLPTTKRPASEG